VCVLGQRKRIPAICVEGVIGCHIHLGGGTKPFSYYRNIVSFHKFISGSKLQKKPRKILGSASSKPRPVDRDCIITKKQPAVHGGNYILLLWKWFKYN